MQKRPTQHDEPEEDLERELGVVGDRKRDDAREAEHRQRIEREHGPGAAPAGDDARRGTPREPGGGGQGDDERDPHLQVGEAPPRARGMGSGPGTEDRDRIGRRRQGAQGGGKCERHRPPRRGKPAHAETQEPGESDRRERHGNGRESDHPVEVEHSRRSHRPPKPRRPGLSAHRPNERPQVDEQEAVGDVDRRPVERLVEETHHVRAVRAQVVDDPGVVPVRFGKDAFELGRAAVVPGEGAHEPEGPEHPHPCAEGEPHEDRGTGARPPRPPHLPAEEPGDSHHREHRRHVRHRHEGKGVPVLQRDEERDEVVVEPDVVEREPGEAGILGRDAAAQDLVDDSDMNPGVGPYLEIRVHEEDEGDDHGRAQRPRPGEARFGVTRPTPPARRARGATKLDGDPQDGEDDGDDARRRAQRKTRTHRHPGGKRGDKRRGGEPQAPARKRSAFERHEGRDGESGQDPEQREEPPVPGHAGQDRAERDPGGDEEEGEGDSGQAGFVSAVSIWFRWAIRRAQSTGGGARGRDPCPAFTPEDGRPQRRTSFLTATASPARARAK
jgi:hypothetical protein